LENLGASKFFEKRELKKKGIYSKISIIIWSNRSSTPCI